MIDLTKKPINILLNIVHSDISLTMLKGTDSGFHKVKSNFDSVYIYRQDQLEVVKKEFDRVLDIDEFGF